MPSGSSKACANESPKVGKDTLKLVDQAIQEITANAGFVAKQFGEYMEDSVDRAKEEVNAYALLTFQSLGMADQDIQLALDDES